MLFFVGVLCTRVDRDRAPHPGVDVWVSSGSDVRCFEDKGCDWQRVGCSICHMTSEVLWPVPSAPK